MKRRRVRFTATARAHVRRLSRWWEENSLRPEIVEGDLEAALDILSSSPGIGSPYVQAPIPGVRRFYLDRLTCHVYYTHDDENVIIRAVWHARRGSGPNMR